MDSEWRSGIRRPLSSTGQPVSSDRPGKGIQQETSKCGLRKAEHTVPRCGHGPEKIPRPPSRTLNTGVSPSSNSDGNILIVKRWSIWPGTSETFGCRQYIGAESTDSGISVGTSAKSGRSLSHQCHEPAEPFKGTTSQNFKQRQVSKIFPKIYRSGVQRCFAQILTRLNRWQLGSTSSRKQHICFFGIPNRSSLVICRIVISWFCEKYSK